MSTKKITFMDIKDNKSIIFAALEIFFLIVGIIAFTVCVATGRKSLYVSQMLPDNIWFNFFSYFTWQSNFFMFALCILYFFNMKFHFIKKPTFLVAGMTYITVTFLVFNTILLPTTLPSNLKSPLWWCLNSPVHIICPIMCLLFFIFVFKAEHKSGHFKFQLKPINWLMFMIYPTIYVVYAVVINFVPITTYGGWDYPSIYGKFTNINPNNDGSLVYLTVILGIELVLFPLAYLIYNSCVYKKAPWKLFTK